MNSKSHTKRRKMGEWGCHHVRCAEATMNTANNKLLFQRVRQETQKFEAILGYIARLYLQQKKKKEEEEEEKKKDEERRGKGKRKRGKRKRGKRRRAY
jgi:hypothetical protein